MNKKIASKLAFSGQHWTGLYIEKCKNSVSEVLIKISISLLNFSTESAKKPSIYGLLFFIAICSPKNDYISFPMKWEVSSKTVTLL